MPIPGKKGVCCTCQLNHPVDLAPADDEERTCQADNYVMSSHDAFGEHCQGTGTIPQAVYDKK